MLLRWQNADHIRAAAVAVFVLYTQNCVTLLCRTENKRRIGVFGSRLSVFCLLPLALQRSAKAERFAMTTSEFMT